MKPRMQSIPFLLPTRPMHNPCDTIAAIATPPGKGGVALIRVSGLDAIRIADRVFKAKNKKPLSEIQPRFAVYGDIRDGDEIVDDGVATVFRAPHSYTGEDTVEIACHGGILVTRTVLSALLTAGAVLADPGEFTERAFISGQISLAGAESIANLLDAQSRAELRLSGRRSSDRLTDAVSAIEAEMMTVSASLFATIDFPDEDLASLSHKEILSRLTAIAERIDSLIRTYRTGRAISEGIRTAIVGCPNVGKSSLYNLLAGDDLAIVTDIPGTTRDVLTETVTLGALKLRISDTAGLRDTSDPVEQIGVTRSHAAIEASELCLAVFDASRPLCDGDRALISMLSESGITTVAILNKSDLPSADMSEVKAAFRNVISLSAKTSDSSALEALLTRLFTDEALVIGEDAILASARQHAALCRARELLSSSIDACRSGLPEDMIAGDLMRAIGAVSELDGRAVSENVVSEIFSRFCVGK